MSQAFNLLVDNFTEAGRVNDHCFCTPSVGVVLVTLFDVQSKEQIDNVHKDYLLLCLFREE